MDKTLLIFFFLIINWQLYINSYVQLEMLKKSHFVSEVFHNGDKTVSFITDPKNFGWKMKDNVFETVLTDLGPVLDIDAALSFCSDQTNCRSMWCKCKKNSLTRI